MSSKLPHGMRNDLCLCDPSVSCVRLALDQRGLDHGIPLRVECHGCDWRPVPGLAAPASWIALASFLVERVAASKQRPVLSGMALSGRDVTDAAVMVLVVVPVHEAGGPLASGIEVSEALGRERGTILGGAEEGCDERIVVADPRAGVRRCDAEPGEHGEHSGGLEGGAIVAVQHWLGRRGVHALGERGTPGEMGGMIGAVGLMHLEADDLAAEQIED